MLVLTRKVGEVVVIGHDTRIAVLAIQGSRVRLGVTAPAEVPVRRDELGRTGEACGQTGKQPAGPVPAREGPP